MYVKTWPHRTVGEGPVADLGDAVLDDDIDDLIREIRASGDFCIGAACYPEVHPESTVQAEDLRWLREKVEAGADFLTTQMFFDNNLLYNFLYKLREKGVDRETAESVLNPDPKRKKRNGRRLGL